MRQTTIAEFIRGYKRRTHQIVISNVTGDPKYGDRHGYIPITFEGTAKDVEAVIKKALGLNGDKAQEKATEGSTYTGSVGTGEAGSGHKEL